MAAFARLRVRLRPQSKARLERAAELANLPLSDFVRAAAEDRADQILAVHEMTTNVPADFFDELFAASDAPPVANEALARA